MKNEIFFRAARNGDLEILGNIIAETKSGCLTWQDGDSRTALFLAAWNNQLKAVKLLKKAGASLKCRDYNNRTPMLAAASYGYHEVVDYILTEEPEAIHDTSDSGANALIEVVKGANENERYKTCVKLLLAKKIPLNHQDDQGFSAIMYAKINELFSLLLTAGADVTLRDKQGFTLLLVLSKRDSEEALQKIKTLIDYKPDLDIKVKNNLGASALDLILATSRLDSLKIETINVFLEQGLSFKPELGADAFSLAFNKNLSERRSILITPENQVESFFWLYKAQKYDELLVELDSCSQKSIKPLVDKVDKDGNTLLMLALKDNKHKLAEKLIPLSELNLVNNSDETALSIAATRGKIDLLNLMIDAGADINYPNKKKEPLVLSLHYRFNAKALTVLIKRGANLDLADENGNTPLMFAVLARKASLVALILSKKPANINEKNHKDMTAFFMAVNEGINGNECDYDEIIDRFIVAKADPTILCKRPDSLIKSATVFDLGRMSHSYQNKLAAYKKEWCIDENQASVSLAPHAVVFKKVILNSTEANLSSALKKIGL